jgi:hypothetical protein
MGGGPIIPKPKTTASVAAQVPRYDNTRMERLILNMIISVVLCE